MPTPRAEKTFLQDHGYGPARLAAATARIDWSRADAFTRARDALALYVDTVVELLKDAARGRRRTLGAFLNELVAGNAVTERQLLWLAVRRLEAEAPVAGLLAARRKLLDDASAPLASHWRLLRDGTLPAPRLPDITTVDTDTLLALHFRQLQESGAVIGPADTLKLLKFAAQLHEQRGETRAALLRNLRALQKLLATADDRVALDHDAFRSLPASLRHALLFTPGLTAFFLDAQAQAAATPPSPSFDPLYLERALENLARGTLDHIDVDTLFLGAASTPSLRAKIVSALANGSGRLACSDDVRERLIAGAEIAELCLVACAAARSPDDVHRALGHLAALPRGRVLGEALRRFALISWRDWLPAQIPELFSGDAAFREGMLEDSALRLAAHLRAGKRDGDDIHQAPAMLFRHVVEWLGLAAPRAARDAVVALEDALARNGGVLLDEIQGSDLATLHRTGPRGAALAHALARALQRRDATRAQDFLRHAADASPALASEFHAVGTILDGAVTDDGAAKPEDVR